MILLAAGASSRMGKPKQLLPYKGKSLLHYMLSVIAETNFNPVIVVTGANSSLIAHELKHEAVTIIHNREWTEGIASSIRTGISALQNNYPDCNGMIIMLADQPYISSSLLNKLFREQKISGKPMAACQYENIPGTPALFHKSLFPELMGLQGDKGAGKILQQRKDEVVTVDFPEGNIDIDTEDDYKTLLNRK